MEKPRKENNNKIVYYPKKALYVYLNEGISELLSKTKQFIGYDLGIVPHILKIGDILGLISPESIYSENFYSKRKNDPYRSETNNIAEVFKNHFEPNSVIDFGCGIGTYLEPFYEDIEIKGIEANKNAFKHSVVPEKFLEYFDLKNKYEPNKKYDLVLSIEVAEHIPKKFANNFAQSLVNATGQTLILTAAPPGQGGTHHVNEQPRDYWIKKFEKKGLKYKSEIVEELREKIDTKKLHHIPKNLFVFEKVNHEQ